MSRGPAISLDERDHILGLIRQTPPIKYARIAVIVGRHVKTVAGIAAANDVRRAGR